MKKVIGLCLLLATLASVTTVTAGIPGCYLWGDGTTTCHGGISY